MGKLEVNVSIKVNGFESMTTQYIKKDETTVEDFIDEVLQDIRNDIEEGIEGEE